MQQDILAKLDALQRELDQLGESISEDRSNVLRQQVIADLRTLLGEYNREVLEAEMEKLVPASSCGNKSACLELVGCTINEARSAYERGDDAAARACLTHLIETKIQANCCQDHFCSTRADHLVEETSRMIELSTKLSSSLASQTANADLPDQQVGDALAPLAHSARISILAALSQGSLAFMEMSHKVGLRTGHLQFHLKTLMNAGLVEKEGTRGHYRMTEKGRKALVGSRRLAAEMA